MTTCVFEKIDFMKPNCSTFRNAESYEKCPELPKLFSTNPELTVKLCCSVRAKFSRILESEGTL
jgi:hypothetical protein